MKDTNFLFTIKKYGYLIFLFPIFLVFISTYLGIKLNAANIFSYAPILIIFFIIPLLDYLVGKDMTNPNEEEREILEHDNYYKIIILACAPILLTLVVFGAYYFSSNYLDWWGKIGLAISVGTVTGGIGITVAHELIHKSSKIEQNSGGLLLALVCYATFKVEHIRGHHKWVSTDLDSSSSQLNQALYPFLLQALKHNFINGWLLEAEQLKKKNLSPFSFHNELIIWYAITTGFALGLTLFFGYLALIYFIIQSLFAILLLEAINYIEHYGLRRKKLANGNYEKTTEIHSWNSNYLLSNLILFHLQRHSDHHTMPKRRYQSLLNYKTSPQLPGGYPAMIVLSLIPPLWFKIINPRIILQY